MRYTNLYAGIEIETILNRDIHDFNIGSYHHGIKLNKYFKLERDTSIHTHESRLFNNKIDCEFITPILKTRTEFFKAIKSFIKVVSKNNKYELKDVIDINKSCGCHIHLSLSNNKKFKNFIDHEILQDTRELFFKKLNNSKKLSKNTIQNITDSYNRYYANLTNKKTWNDDRTPRLQEFNAQSEYNNRGLEWRSFNLCRVENWIEFEELFKIAYDTIYFLFTKRTKGYKLAKQRIRINKKELKTLFNQEKKTTEQIEININQQKITTTFIKNSDGVYC